MKCVDGKSGIDLKGGYETKLLGGVSSEQPGGGPDQAGGSHEELGRRHDRSFAPDGMKDQSLNRPILPLF